jgi:hypothetical protein
MIQTTPAAVFPCIHDRRHSTSDKPFTAPINPRNSTYSIHKIRTGLEITSHFGIRFINTRLNRPGRKTSSW